MYLTLDNELEPGTNPVKRVLLSVLGNEGDLFMCPIHMSDNNCTGNGSNGGSTGNGSSSGGDATGNGNSGGTTGHIGLAMGSTGGNTTEAIFTMQHQIAAIH